MLVSTALLRSRQAAVCWNPRYTFQHLAPFSFLLIVFLAYCPSTTCCILSTLFASYFSTNQTHMCSHDRAIFCSTEYPYGTPPLGATPSLMADRICVESSDCIMPIVLFVLSSQFQILFVWRECLGLQVLIVLTVLSFRFSRTVLQGKKN